MARKMYRQGDVLIIERQDSRPIPRNDLKPVKSDPDGAVVLARGEVTGHNHSFRMAEAAKVELFKRGMAMVLLVAAQAKLQHEEHATIDIDAGEYDVIIQREYRPSEDAVRLVED